MGTPAVDVGTRAGSPESERLRTLIEKIPSMVAYWDSSLRCRFANRAYERWFGVSPEALIGKHISELLGPLYELNLPYIEGALRGEQQEFERAIPDPSGGAARHSVASYIPDLVDGSVRGFFVLVTDVSAIKRVELALRESEERFRLTIDEAPIGMALVAKDGRFVRVNRALCEIVGYTTDELTGLTFQAITHPDDLDADLALAGQLARGEIPRYQLEKRYIRKDGTVVEIMLSGSVVRAHDGAPLYFIAQIEDITERKRMETERRLAEARSSGILAISADAIISVDEQQRITMFNKGAESIFGYSANEAIGAPLDLLVPESLRAIHRVHMDRFAAGQEVARRMGERTATIRGRRKNGEEFPADSTISKLVIDGKPFLTVALRDITEPERAREALRQSQERVELALEGADLASWDWNIETGEVVYNARWGEMRGYRPEEVKPHVDSWTSGLHDDDRARVEKALKEHFEGKTAEYDTEHRVLTKSGQWLWILDRGKVFARDAAGRPTRMVGTELDITERKRVQDRQAFLADVGEVLGSTLDFEDTLTHVARLAVRQMADCVFVDVIEAGDQLRRLLVVHADPAKTELCDELKRVCLDGDRLPLGAAIIDARRPTLMVDVGAEYIESVAENDEQLRSLRELDPRSMMAVPLSGRDGLLGTLLFVSSRRRYGAADLQLAEELTHRASLAIDNARLYRAAQRATASRDEVLGVVAHDLRNPLGAILMQVDVLQHLEAEAAPGSRRAAETIGRAARRMNHLIQDLLDVTRTEAGRLSLSLEGVPAGQIVRDSIDGAESVVRSASLELRVDVARDVPQVWADRDRLLQVFENLIGNAVKFTEPGGAITVGAASRGDEVRFWVTDTGAGVAEEDVPHLFDRFWQARNVSRVGAGLGLPIVKGIVEAHRGKVWVESALGRGTTIFFTIPTAHPHRGEAPKIIGPWTSSQAEKRRSVRSR
jgi:PAS domain S-box-containing protein